MSTPLCQCKRALCVKRRQIAEKEEKKQQESKQQEDPVINEILSIGNVPQDATARLFQHHARNDTLPSFDDVIDALLEDLF